jgi:hypothetical protein
VKIDLRLIVQRLGPDDGDLGPSRGGNVGSLKFEARLSRDRIDVKRDSVPNATALDDSDAALAGERIRHGDERLKGIALLASRRGLIDGGRGGPETIIGDPLDRLGRYSISVVGDSDAALVDGDVDDRRDALALSGVQRIIDQLFEGGGQPVLRAVPDEAGQLLRAGELAEAGSCKLAPPWEHARRRGGCRFLTRGGHLPGRQSGNLRGASELARCMLSSSARGAQPHELIPPLLSDSMENSRTVSQSHRQMARRAWRSVKPTIRSRP